MESAVIWEFLDQQKNMDERNYLLTTVAFIAAPTIIHNKPSTLTSFTIGKRNLYHAWDRYKQLVYPTLGIEFVELQRTKCRVMVLFYKRSRLKETLAKVENSDYLIDQGYPASVGLDEALIRLKYRMKNGFPHEIGVFLGYPLNDVISFIEHEGKDYLLCQYWKVYHNPERASKLFEDYDQAKIQVLRSMKNGNIFGSVHSTPQVLSAAM